VLLGISLWREETSTAAARTEPAIAAEDSAH
jgi:hypothetical protein